MTSAAVVVIYLAHCYGDMGLGTWTSVFTVAPALVVVGQLAIKTGAWPRKHYKQGPPEKKRVVVLGVERVTGAKGAAAA